LKLARQRTKRTILADSISLDALHKSFLQDEAERQNGA
jgi:hypothetical protein